MLCAKEVHCFYDIIFFVAHEQEGACGRRVKRETERVHENKESLRR